MKELVSLALSAVLALSVVACGSSDTAASQQSPLLKALMRLHLQTEPSRSVESDRSPVEQQFMARLL